MKKIRIKVLPIAFLMAIISVVAAVGLIYNMLEKSNNPLLTNKPDIVLPNFVGQTETQAKADENFNFEVEYVYSDEVEKDIIISQKPKAPRSVKQSSTIKLKVSKGVMTSEMPDVRMESRALAEETLNKLGVHIYFQKEVSENMPAGLVIRTDPEMGTPINSGDMVTVYISTAEKVKNGIVPNLIGTDIVEARKAVVKARLKLNVINIQTDAPAGTVMWQNHGAGAQLPIGTPIELHVSVGPAEDD